MTLIPLAAAVVLVALHAGGYATRRLGIALAVIAAVLPAVGVALLAPAVGPGDPIMVQPLGGGAGFTAWIAPAFRVDPLAIYAGLGCASLVLPLLFWLSFAQRSEPAQPDPQVAPATALVVADSVVTLDDPDVITTPKQAGRLDWHQIIGMDAHLDAATVRSLAFTCLLAAALLAAVFADSLVMAGVAWLVVAASAWAIGESASDGEHLDRLGLGISLAGPLVWVIVIVLVARGTQSTRFLQLTGLQSFNVIESIVVALALVLAGGAYPTMAWIRRRAAFASPAGLGALVLTALPLAIYLGARTYALAADAQARWPLIGVAPTGTNAPPPVTVGILFATLGAFTVAVAGLLALGKRDARALLALLATAQLGWALLALGAGTPVSAPSVVMLLSTTVLGLGAMVASVVADGAITTDVEPDADGPRPAGAPAQPASLAAWSIGAATLIGVPLFAGFVGRQLASAGTLQAGGLNVPLGAICWAGDALLALALLRATAPAFAERLRAAGDADEKAPSRRFTPNEIPGAVFALIAVLMAVLPGYALVNYAGVAAQTLVASGSLTALLKGDALGYSYFAGSTQLLSGILWLAAALLTAIVLALQPAGSSRHLLPVVGADVAEAGAETEGPATLAEPENAWHDLAGAFSSPATLVGRSWLLNGIDDADEAEAAEQTEEDETDEDAVTVTAGGEEVARDDE
jgi:formate hydrogenlyase subunit 3/multisubunit Na+/H+ antiporter MnhD subunit